MVSRIDAYVPSPFVIFTAIRLQASVPSQVGFASVQAGDTAESLPPIFPSLPWSIHNTYAADATPAARLRAFPIWTSRILPLPTAAARDRPSRSANPSRP